MVVKLLGYIIRSGWKILYKKTNPEGLGFNKIIITKIQVMGLIYRYKKTTYRLTKVNLYV